MIKIKDVQHAFYQRNSGEWMLDPSEVHVYLDVESLRLILNHLEELNAAAAYSRRH